MQKLISYLLLLVSLLSLPALRSASAEKKGGPDSALTASDCQRLRVVWSGGVARRGPDRVAPRPVRSRWQRADASRIRCPKARSVFQKLRVSDRPEIR